MAGRYVGVVVGRYLGTWRVGRRSGKQPREHRPVLGVQFYFKVSQGTCFAGMPRHLGRKVVWEIAMGGTMGVSCVILLGGG